MSKSWMRTPQSNQHGLGPLFDLKAGKELRDEGIKQVSDHNEDWMENCYCRAFSFVNGVKPEHFTGEDIRLHCQKHEAEPKHPNAWGALINTLIKRKIITPTGEHRPMKDKTSHARSTPVYKAI